MNLKVVNSYGMDIALADSDTVCISDTQTALDFMMTVNGETGCHSVVINLQSRNFVAMKTIKPA